MERIRKHLELLIVRMKEDFSDQNPFWLVFTVCLLSVGMAIRMAQAAHWVEFQPLVSVPLPVVSDSVQQGNALWASVTDPRLSCVALSCSVLLITISRLERWQTAMVTGLCVLMAWWYATSSALCLQTGLGIGALYAVIALTTSLATIKTYRLHHRQQAREAEVDHAVQLLASVLDLHSVMEPSPVAQKRNNLS